MVICPIMIDFKCASRPAFVTTFPKLGSNLSSVIAFSIAVAARLSPAVPNIFPSPEMRVAVYEQSEY